MKSVIQRVARASVKVDNEIKGQIEEGLLILLGVEPDDTESEVDLLANKIANLRIFCDENDKMNLSLLDINGEALVISNFTLCGDCRKGRRPYFGDAATPDIAEPLYDSFCRKISLCGVSKVEKGVFGADMKVELLNDGPVTITINSKELPHKC
ncbi:MAG: D-aminoacyl-tRNA deacylase [Acutalibacteraceae bacterium]|nr:D-aminoacyl-tRNA deacylase [Acutalibacteraceae bacterium]